MNMTKKCGTELGSFRLLLNLIYLRACIKQLVFLPAFSIQFLKPQIPAKYISL